MPTSACRHDQNRPEPRLLCTVPRPLLRGDRPRVGNFQGRLSKGMEIDRQSSPKYQKLLFETCSPFSHLSAATLKTFCDKATRLLAARSQFVAYCLHLRRVERTHVLAGMMDIPKSSSQIKCPHRQESFMSPSPTCTFPCTRPEPARCVCVPDSRRPRACRTCRD